MANPETEIAPVQIGFRDPDFNRIQYSQNFGLYLRSNPKGTKGGKTPPGRVAAFRPLLPAGRTVLEAGSAGGLDALELIKAGYKVKASDIAEPALNHLTAMGLDASFWDARIDHIPDGVDGLYGNVSAAVHISPKDFTRLLARSRKELSHEKAVFFSALYGFGHERTKRTGEFQRDFFYYTPDRLEQILDQEGVKIASPIEIVVAGNKSVTLHAYGNFQSGYQKTSYGERDKHPFGDVLFSIGALDQGHLVEDLIDAHAQIEFLTGEERDYLKRATFLLRRSNMPNEMAEEINNTWAKCLAGREINTVIQHAKDFLTQQPRFRLLTAAALAVCNNNGFSATLVGYEPHWLLEVAAEHLGTDKLISTQWSTDGDSQFTGSLTGEVYFTGNTADPEEAVKRQKQRLTSWFGNKYKRVMVGVGQSRIDLRFLERTDYPILAFIDEDKYLKHFAHKKGAFKDIQELPVHAGKDYFLRWPLMEEEDMLVKYLHMITSGRLPVQPHPDCENDNKPLWTCPVNILNDDFYAANQLPTKIL